MKNEIKNIYAFETKEEYHQVEKTISNLKNQIVNYQKILEDKYFLLEPPKAIVWTSSFAAKNIFSNTWTMAYTRQDSIFISVNKVDWLEVFHEQLDGNNITEIDDYYTNNIDLQLRELVCHELTHHIDLFPGDFDDYELFDMWFEEGMAFYLPRKYLLSDEEFKDIYHVEKKLFQVLNSKYGNHSILEFGKGEIEKSIPSMMFDYWRSFLLVNYLIENKFVDDMDFFEQYNKFFPKRREVSFEEYFGVNFTEIFKEIEYDN